MQLELIARDITTTASVAFTNTLSSIEVKEQMYVLKLPPGVAFMVLSIIMNGKKNYNLQATCETVQKVSDQEFRSNSKCYTQVYPIQCIMA